MGEGFEDGMVMDTSPTPEVSTETIEVPEINTEPIESTDISSVDSIEPMEDVGDIEGSVDGTPSMLDQISEGGNALEEFHEADELSEVTDEYPPMLEQIEGIDGKDTDLDNMDFDLNLEDSYDSDAYPSIEEQLDEGWSEEDYYQSLGETPEEMPVNADLDESIEMESDSEMIGSEMAEPDIEAPGLEESGLEEAGSGTLELEENEIITETNEDEYIEGDIETEEYLTDESMVAVTEGTGEDGTETYEDVTDETGEDGTETYEDVTDETGEDGAETGEGATDETGEDGAETGEGATDETGEDGAETNEDVTDETGEDGAETNEDVTDETGEDGAETNEDVTDETGEAGAETNEDVTDETDEAGSEAGEDATDETAEDVTETDEDATDETGEDVTETDEDVTDETDEDVTETDEDVTDETDEDVTETDEDATDEDATDETGEDETEGDTTDEIVDGTDEDNEDADDTDNNTEETSDSGGSTGGKRLEDEIEDEEKPSEEEGFWEDKEEFLKNDNFDTTLLSALNENNADKTTLENMNNTINNLDAALESVDFKMEQLKEMEETTVDPQEKKSLQNQLSVAQEYKTMLEETKLISEQRRVEALDLSSDKLSEMNEKAASIQEFVDENKKEIRDGNCTDADFEKIAADTTDKLEIAKSEQILINQACDMKFHEIFDYVSANNMDRFDCQFDPEYRRMVNQYKQMLETKDQVTRTVSGLENTHEIIGIESDGRVRPVSPEIKSPEIHAENIAGGDDVRDAVKEADAVLKNMERGKNVTSTEMDTVFTGMAYANIQLDQQIEAKREEMLSLNLTKQEAAGDISFQKLNSEYEALKNQKERISERTGELEKSKAAADIKTVDVRLEEAYEDGYFNPYKGNVFRTEPPELIGKTKEEINTEYERTLGYDFITNDGEKITFKEGMNRIIRTAQGYMNEMKIAPAEQECAIAEIEETIKRQHYCAMQRALGDHGVKHIYGNFERSDLFMKGMDAESKLAILLAEVHHDEGYTDPSIHSPGNFKAGTHGMLSAADFEKYHRAAYENLFSDSHKLDSVVKAMATHNDSYDFEKGYVKGASLSRKDMIDNLDVERDTIVASLHLADKMALSEREKFPLVMTDPEMKKLQQEALLSNELMKKSGMSGEDLKAYEERVNAQLQEGVKKYFEGKKIPEDLKQNYEKAIKDINSGSGKFNLPMNMIGMSSDALQMEISEGKLVAVMHIDVLDENSAKEIIGKDCGRQIKKICEDMHMPGDKAKEAMDTVLASKSRDVAVNLDNGNRIIFHKNDIIPEDIRDTRSEIAEANNEFEKSNLVKYSEHCEKIKEALESENLEKWSAVFKETSKTVRLLWTTGNVENARELEELLDKAQQEREQLEERTKTVSMESVKVRQEKRVIQAVSGHYKEFFEKHADIYLKYHQDFLQKALKDMTKKE